MLCSLVGCGGGTSNAMAQNSNAQPASTASDELKLDSKAAQVEQPDPVAYTLRTQPIYPSAIRTVTFDPSGQNLLVGDGKGFIYIVEVKGQQLGKNFKAHEEWTFDLAFSRDGSRLASGGGDNLIKLWDSKDWKLVKTLVGHTDDLHGVAFTDDGKQLVSGSDDATVRLWDIETGESRTLGEHDAQVTSVVVSPDGAWAATGSRDETIRVWDLRSEKLAHTLKGHTEDVLDVAFSYDGKWLASTSYDKTVKIWSTADWSQAQSLEGHGDWVFAAAFSNDDQFVVTASGDDKIRSFAREDGKLLSEVNLPTDVSDVAINKDSVIGAGLISGKTAFFKFDAGKIGESLGPIPTDKPPPHQAEILEPAEYLELHNLLAAEAPGSDWSKKVARLSASGDAYTLMLIEKQQVKKRTAPQLELLTRMRDGLAVKYPEGQPKIAEAEFERMLRRAAMADTVCDPQEGTLVPWITGELKKQVAADPKSRAKLQEMQKQFAASDDKKPEDEFIHERIGVYLKAILDESNSATVEAKTQ